MSSLPQASLVVAYKVLLCKVHLFNIPKKEDQYQLKRPLHVIS